MSLMHGHPPAVQVRYIRADLATTNAAREVRPLTRREAQNRYSYTPDLWFAGIMAARGIEVGE
jgi:hypothetical protein